MASKYIPQTKPTKLTFWQSLRDKIPNSFYIGKLKVQADFTPAAFRLGVTVYPRYKQFEINFGKYALNFWYRG